MIVLLLASVSAKIAFVFELVRHGARADLLEGKSPGNFFKVGKGMLTASGMRQRYLLGAYNKRKYRDLLSSEFKYGEVYVQSTDVFRTIQSAYSEVLGMYPPTETHQWTKREQILVETVAKPPFKMRNLDR